LGHQKQTNYALRPDMTKQDFIKEVTTGLVKPPSYFPANVMMNIKGYESIDKILERGLRAFPPAEFEAVANETGALVLDVRPAHAFAKGFIPNSINIGLDGSFAPWVGTLIPDIKQEILLVADAGTEAESITRLSRVGYDRVIGFLDGGIDSWKMADKELDHVASINADQLADLHDNDPNINILDVRKNSEYESEHIMKAINAPLDFINEAMPMIDKNKTYYVHCAGGYRSMIFTSILRARGFHNLVDVKGGMSAIKATNRFRLSEYVCPTTLL